MELSQKKEKVEQDSSRDLLEDLGVSLSFSDTSTVISVSPDIAAGHKSSIIIVLKSIEGLERHKKDAILHHLNQAIAQAYHRAQADVISQLIADCEQKQPGQ